MKKLVFVLLFGLSFIYWKHTSGYIKPFKLKTIKQTSSALTAEDRKNYIVSISEAEISKPQSASSDPAFQTKSVFIKFWVKLSNNSNDTLKYLNKSCGWAGILKTDNEKLHITQNYCPDDVTEIVPVPPHKSTGFLVFVHYNKTKISAKTPFKIGVGVFKFVNKQQLLTFDAAKSFTATHAANIIWSNTVAIPQ